MIQSKRYLMARIIIPAGTLILVPVLFYLINVWLYHHYQGSMENYGRRLDWMLNVCFCLMLFLGTFGFYFWSAISKYRKTATFIYLLVMAVFLFSISTGVACDNGYCP